MSQNSAVLPAPSLGGKIVYTLLMFILFAGIFGGVIYAVFSAGATNAVLLGIPAMLVFGILCFTIKKGFRLLVMWWGILALATCAWWAYLATQ